MTNKKLGTLAAFEKIKFFIQLCGLWNCDLSPKYLSLLYNAYSAAMIAFLFLYDISVNAYVFFIENVQEAADNLTTSFTLLALFGKILNFRYFLPKIQNLLRMADEFQLENDWESKFVDRQMLAFRKLAIVFLCSANLAVSFNSISTIMADNIRLPYLAWVPFDWKSNSTAYAWVYTYQVVGVVIQSNLNVCLDLAMSYLMHVASIKFEILGVRLQKLSEMTKGVHGKAVQETKELIRCISVYQRIWK